jgi:hypothetical protein
MINDNLNLDHKEDTMERRFIHALEMTHACYEKGSAIDIKPKLLSLKVSKDIRLITRVPQIPPLLSKLFNTSAIWNTELDILSDAFSNIIKYRVLSVSPTFI